jgi:hypothetical protein
MPYTIGVKIKVSRELASVKAMKEIIGKKNVLQEIGQYAVERLEHHSPDSIKGGWVYNVSGNTLTVTHKKTSSQVLWWLEYGTKAHWVEPVNAKVLHWQEGGKDYYSMGHMVSGIKPSLFFAKASDDVEAYIKNKYRAIGLKGTSVSV